MEELTTLTKVCRDCSERFQISAREQAFFARPDLQLRQPTRCPACRHARRKQRDQQPPHDANPRATAIPGLVTTGRPMGPLAGSPGG